MPVLVCKSSAPPSTVLILHNHTRQSRESTTRLMPSPDGRGQGGWGVYVCVCVGGGGEGVAGGWLGDGEGRILSWRICGCVCVCVCVRGAGGGVAGGWVWQGEGRVLSWRICGHVTPVGCGVRVVLKGWIVHRCDMSCNAAAGGLVFS